MENSIEFFLNTHLEWSLSRQDLVIIVMLPMHKYTNVLPQRAMRNKADR